MHQKQKLKTDVSRIFELIGTHMTSYITCVVISAICGTVMNISFANSVKLLINVFIYDNRELIPKIILFVSTSVVTGCILRPVFVYLQNREIENIIRDIRIKCFLVLQEFPTSYFEKKHSSETFTAINRAIDTTRESITFIINMVENIISVLLVIPYIISLDLRFGLIAIFISVLSSVFNAKVRLPLRNRSRSVWQEYDIVSKRVIESVTGFNIMKMFGLQEHMKKKFDKATGYLLSMQKRLTRISALIFGMNAFIGWFNNAFLSILGCWFVLTGTMDASVLVASVMVSSNFTWGIIFFGENLARLQEAFEGIDILYRLFNEEKELSSYITDGNSDDLSVSFKDIEFGYEQNKPVICTLSFEAKEGSCIALVGNSGGGKSTIAKLVLGLYPVWDGEITIMGKALKEYTLEELRNKIAYVSQDAYIFNDTIKENILIGNPLASDEEIQIAADKANAHTFIMQQKDGYGTLIGERGVKLSRGQRQRIAIARAILKNAPILVLDEATSSLDNESEVLVQSALNTVMEGKTSIIIAHRLSTVENADVIYFIDNGVVVEQGTHQSLLDKKGRYCELYYREFMNES
jgi:ATP-binding cassette subfamily B protein